MSLITVFRVYLFDQDEQLSLAKKKKKMQTQRLHFESDARVTIIKNLA